MDFTPAAQDYKKHRPGFPYSFFAHVPLHGRVLDLGSGTGTLARGFSERGCRAVALDCSAEMLAQAEGDFEKVVAKAEACPFPDASFDAVAAGQCWHWFDGWATARECARVLKPGGTVVIAHFSYLPINGNIAEQTEQLILKYNPTWAFAGLDGRYEIWRPHLEAAGFESPQSFAYEEDIVFTHESWRGRFRACNGVFPLADTRRQEFDSELQLLLQNTQADPFVVPHRIFVISAQSPKKEL